ncbi:MAG TPA: DUF192 domain-containing protein [Methyloversatilis sp.]
MKRILPGLLLTCLFAVAQAQAPTLDLSVGLYRIQAEVAATQKMRMTGLMRRTEMAAGAGMLFVFTERQKHCMWMRNTLIPLSVAFIDEQGVIINIEDMQPQTDTAHCAGGPARYALETNAGWFAARKITAGTRIAGLERAPAPN